MFRQGFIYGHYDSRGGATFVTASTRKEADTKYAESAGWADEDNWKGWVDEDFMGTANLNTYEETFPHGEDLDPEYRSGALGMERPTCN